jgi:peptidoglycan/LPS O-acetylase OafA/YrhL
LRPSDAGASGAPASLGRIDALDGIRAIAILAVLGWHANEQVILGGHLGVAVFFTLSGFLITTLLLDERRATGRVDLRRFYRRRAARLVPAMLVATAASGLLALMHPWESTPRQALVGVVSTLTYTSNVVSGFAKQSITSMLTWSWTLSLEEQFYLLWPALFLLGMRNPRRRRPLLWGGLAAYVGLSAWRVVVAGGFGAGFSNRVYYAPDTRVDAVAVGCLLALWLHRSARRSPLEHGRTAMLAALAMPALAMLLALLVLSEPVRWSFLTGLQLAPLLTAVVIAGVVSSSNDGLVRSALSWRPLVWLGRRSYSVYLWNTFFLYGMPPFLIHHWLEGGFLVWFAITFVTAHLSYVFIEQPFLRKVRSSATRRNPSAEHAARPARAARPDPLPLPSAAAS